LITLRLPSSIRTDRRYEVIAQSEGFEYDGRLFRSLSAVASDIVEAIINGEEPDGLSLAKLTRNFPEDWREQRRFFGVGDNCA
jgi:hypothetical protein